jgi:hypothetical protein
MLEPENIFNWNMALDHSGYKCLFQKNHVNPLNPSNHGSDNFCASQAPLRSCLRQRKGKYGKAISLHLVC